MKGFFRSPKESISVFSENIKERTVSHWETREKLQYHDIPLSVLSGNTNAKHQKWSSNHNILNIHDVQYHLSVLNHHISEFLKTLTQNIEYQSHISLCWPQMLPDKTGCFEPWKALRLTGPKMVSTCEKSISKRVFTSIWLTHISFSLLSFKITGKQAWFWFLCYQTRHQNFRWKHGYFIKFSILRCFVNCIFIVAI